jgi:acyl carrier protein
MADITIVRELLRQTLQLGPRADSFRADTPLLGSIPELDSMAVVNVLTALEDQCGIIIDDGEVSAQIFETVGTLAAFVEDKTQG